MRTLDEIIEELSLHNGTNDLRILCLELAKKVRYLDDKLDDLESRYIQSGGIVE